MLLYILKISLALSLTHLLGCGSNSTKSQKDLPQKHNQSLQPDQHKTNSLSPSQPSTTPLAGKMVEEIPMDLGRLSNLDDMRRHFNLEEYHRAGYFGQRIKIAVFDNGFAGLTHSLDKRLPPNLSVEQSNDSRMQPSSHGTKMAEIIYAVASGSPEYSPGKSAPEIYLFNTNGFTNLQKAIDRAIELKINVILYAQVWEFGGQFDGDGFINQEVNRAINAGILWVNASGNAGASTYTGKVQSKVGHWITFRNQKDRLKFVVPQNDTPTKIVLSWSDFKDSKNYKTKIDFDMILEDSNGNLLEEGKLNQNGAIESKAGHSAHARESIELTLNSGVYEIGVHYKANLDLSEDTLDARSRFRITVVGSGITMPEGTPDDSLPIPADNQGVLAVGALDTDSSGKWVPSGSLATLREKPDLWLKSEVVFTDPEEKNPNFQSQAHYGTSAASAIASGILSVYMSVWGLHTYQDILDACKTKTLNCKNLILPALAL